MQDNNQPERQHHRRKTASLKQILIPTLLIVVVVALAGIFYFSKDQDRQEPLGLEPLETMEQPPSLMDREQISGPEDASKIILEQDSLITTTAELDIEESATPGAITETAEEKKAKECRILAEQVHGFFTHIDSEDYMKQFDLQKPSQEHFITLAYKLLNNPPVVSRESDDLYTILKNMAHFFRVIGKDNIVLIKTILDRERDKIEDVAAELYQWTTWGACNDDLLQFSPALKDMYEYAGFFLNTMGGRSYLFRRDSRSRLLVNYYSVLLIERANKNGINRHGIDITQIIPPLVQEIDSSNQLIYKENYIDSLYTLLEKYQ